MTILEGQGDAKVALYCATHRITGEEPEQLPPLLLTRWRRLIIHKRRAARSELVGESFNQVPGIGQ